MILSRSGEASVSESVRDAGIELFWLPHRARITKGDGFAVESTIWIFVAGVAFASIVKPFVESVAAEAGKDFWQAIRRAIGATRQKQAEGSYTVSGRSYVVVEQGEDWVAISVPLPTVSAVDERSPAEQCHAEIERHLRLLASNWDDIQGQVEEFGIGRTRHTTKPAMSRYDDEVEGDNTVHVVEEWDGEYRIHPVSARDFFGETR